MQLLHLQSLIQSNIEDIVSLHQLVLDQSFLNNFGKKSLILIYQSIVKNDQNIVLAVKDKDKVVGFLVGTKNNDQFVMAVMKDNLIPLSLEIFKKSILKPALLIKLLSLFIGGDKNIIKAELQFVAINPDYQGRGLGTQLLKKLGDIFNRDGITSFQVGTKADNPKSNQFYKNLGFTFDKEKKIFGDKFNYYLSPPLR